VPLLPGPRFRGGDETESSIWSRPASPPHRVLTTRLSMISGRLISAVALLALVAAAAPLALALPAGDPARGERIYGRCVACHAIDRDRTGPRHAGLFGRHAGGVPGFPYSAALKKAGANGLVWNDETLDKFLQNPTRFVPGTHMTYAGVKDDQERADLIAYLKAATAGT
jgi:cytochrome c